MAKIIRMRIPAGQAKPAPPVGTQLGGAGLNIMGFCKDFNAKTQDYVDGTPIPVVITAYKDRTFEYYMKSPPVTYFLLKAAGLLDAPLRAACRAASARLCTPLHASASLLAGGAAARLPGPWW